MFIFEHHPGHSKAVKIDEIIGRPAISLKGQDIWFIASFSSIKLHYIYTCNLSYVHKLNPFTADPAKVLTLPYWSNPPFLIFDIRAVWRSGLSAAPKCQKLKMVG